MKRKKANRIKVLTAGVLAACLIITGISFVTASIKAEPIRHKENHICLMSHDADDVIRMELAELNDAELADETTGPDVTGDGTEEESTTKEEESTTEEPEATTEEPETTTEDPETTTEAPESTTAAPETTTEAPESTTAAPETTTGAPESTTAAPETTTEAPESTTEEPDVTTGEETTKQKETKEKKSKKKKDRKKKEDKEDTDEEESSKDLDAYEDIGVVVNDNPEKFGTLYWPLPSEYGSEYVTSPFGYRTGKYAGMHAGLDIGAPEGTPIYACEDGVVIASYYSESAGNFTIIEHEDGIFTEYMHQSVRYVKSGEKVKAGQLIGLVGNTGWSTGSHLHLGVVLSDNGYDISRRVNPLPYLIEKNAKNKKSAGKTSKNGDISDSVREISESDLRLYYSDGKLITDEVSANRRLVKNLEPIFTEDTIIKTAHSGFDKKGYLVTGKEAASGKTQERKNAVGLTVEPGYSTLKNTWVRYETEKYDLLITFVSAYNSAEEDCPLTVRLDKLDLIMNQSLYKKADQKKAYYEELTYTPGQYYAIGLHVEILKHGTKKRTEVPEIYQEIHDVDMGQAYICLNDPYLPENLFMKSKKAFNRNRSSNSRMSYITDQGYVYSDYQSDPVEVVKNPSKANLFRETDALSEEGLDLVFGFTHSESAGLAFYLPKKTVTFKAGKGGSVSFHKTKVLYGESVEKGAIAKADKGYKFKYWVTNQDVRVEDKVFKKGDKITLAQIENLAVSDNLTFTAKFTKR